MDPTIVAATIGGLATLGAAALGLWSRYWRKSETERVSPERTKEGGTSVPAEIRDSTPRFSNYRLLVTTECRQDLEVHGLTETRLLHLVAREFEFHTNYLLFDLEDYILPVRDGFLVYLDKIGTRVTFKRIFSCTKDQAKLANWTDILAIYRRATRLSYRMEPDKLAFSTSMFAEAREIHLEIIRRIEKHFDLYEGMMVEPVLRASVRELLESQIKSSDKTLEKFLRNQKNAEEVAFHLEQSRAALREAAEIRQQVDTVEVVSPSLLGPLVTAVERSLQHLHKIIIRYPPTAEFPTEGLDMAGMGSTERPDVRGDK